MTHSLKILQSGSSFFEWGGLEIFLLNYCEALQKRGHEVVLTCPPASFMETEAKLRGIRTIAISTRRGEYGKAFLAYCHLMHRERFDVVHTHIDKTFRSVIMAGLLMGIRRRIHTFYTPDATKLSLPISYYNRATTHFFAVSEDTRLHQIQNGVPADKIRVIPNAIDAVAFRAGVNLTQVEAYQTAWRGGGNFPLVGFAGRIVPEKGWSDFIEAIALVPEVRGVVIGDGYDKGKLLSLIDTLDISERVTFAGFIKDMPSALASLDIFVLPSVYPEPLSTVCLQAMALGLPIIGTSLGGTPEMIDHGKTGLLVPPHAPEQLAEAIQDLLGDTEGRHQMGEAGKKRMEEKFALETMVETLEDLYQK
jgi:glycosyltransferase involved in cell wall biosynthesis